MGYKMSGPSLYPEVNGYRKGHTDTESKVIPPNSITMTEENGAPLEKGPIRGTGTTTGNTKIMKPGKDYEFPGDKEVKETPLLKTCNCWDGHSRVPGTKPCAPGSCKKD
jgi:hypothetical protein